jgi:hypothetical protein
MKKLTLLFMAIIAFGAVIAQDIPDNWNITTTGYTITETTEVANVSDGTSAAIINWDSTDSQKLRSDDFAVTEGAAIVLSLDVIDNDEWGRTRIGIGYDDEFITWTTDVGCTANTTDLPGYQTLTLTDINVPAGVTTAYLEIRFYDVGGASFVDATNTIDNVIVTLDGGVNMITNGSFETWSTPVLEPALSVTAPVNETIVAVDNVDIAFSVENFVLDADGSFEYVLNGGTAQYAITSPVNVAGLTEGANTIEMQLVNMSDLPLNPAVTVTRTVNYEIPSTDPALSITSPTDAQEVTTADVDITFNVLNFDLGTDGSVKYTVDSDPDLFTTTSPIELTGLADGSHTVTMELVNMSDASLIPAVTDEVTFTVNTVAPTTTPIYDIQYTIDVSGNSPLMDQTVITTGFVTAVFEDKFWLQDITGAWNGVYVYYTTTPGPARGDSVMVSGTVVEYNNLTEIGTVTNMTVLTSGNTLPAADAISTVSIGDEDYEGVLVTVTGTCTNPDAGYGMWEVNDGSGAVAMDDLLYAYTPVLGNSYTITGVVDYSFDEWKILPRDDNDIVNNGVSTDPLLIVTYPENNETVYQTSLDLTYTLTNFIIGTDGNVAWNLDGGTDAYVTTSPIAISDLTDGAHVINLELVDMSNDPLDPAVTVAVNISGPTYTSISDIQNGIVTGDVWVKAVVSANFNGAEFGEGYYLQQGGGEWNGIYVFDEENIPSIGDSVVIAGSIDEFFDMTQIESVTSYSVIGIDGIVASPTAVTTLSAASEEYESVLVKVVNATCDTIQNGFGEWWVNDGSGLLMCKDNGVFDFTEVLGTSYDITGIIGYSYSKFSIQYRRESDISVHSGIDSEFANTISLYPNPATDLINVVTEGAETIVITNMVGQVIAEVSVKSEIETINISEYPAGVYFVKITKANESAVVKMIIE